MNMEIFDLILDTFEKTVGRKATLTERLVLKQEFKSLMLSFDKTVTKEINAFIKRRKLL